MGDRAEVLPSFTEDTPGVCEKDTPGECEPACVRRSLQSRLWAEGPEDGVSEFERDNGAGVPRDSGG